jgi:hypothetical protein
MRPEDLIEDATKYYPTVLRDHDTATNFEDSRTTAQQLHLDMDQIVSILLFVVHLSPICIAYIYREPHTPWCISSHRM